MHIAALYVHPVKSCRGIAVDAWPLDPTGLRWDRHFMLVDGDGAFVTQRELPALARVVTGLDEAVLRLDADGLPSCTLPLAPPPAGAPRRTVRVWRSEVPAVDQGDEAAAWFAAAVGRPLRLVRLAPEAQRPVDPDRSPRGTITGFADGYPVLVATTASLDDLGGRLGGPVDPRRFRPNVVVAGSEPWAEDAWRSLQVGAARLELVKPCDRCAVVTVDPDAGVAGREPLRTLAGFRRREGLVLFGINAIVSQPGLVRVGDAVRVLSQAGAASASAVVARSGEAAERR